MSSIFYVITMYILWIINLFNSTGLGQTYKTTEVARVVVYILTIFVAVFEYYNSKKIGDDPREVLAFGGMAIFFVLDSFFQEQGAMGLNYLWIFCLVYLVGKLSINETALKVVGIGYAIAGMVILFIFNHGSALSGWNPNSIAIMGLNSFLIFTVPFYHLGSVKGKVIIAFVAAAYIWLIYPTESRSSMLFIVIGVLFALTLIPYSVLISSNKKIILCLLIPLFVAVVVVLISKSPYMEGLNSWSNKQFNKTFFNGRDDFWDWGFDVLLEHPMFGTGNLDMANWHNSIMTCLTAYGIPGLILWVNVLFLMLKNGLVFLQRLDNIDNILVGCIVSFLLSYIHQSVELGFISSSPSLLPYLFLAIMFGRIKQLRVNNKEEFKELGKVY